MSLDASGSFANTLVFGKWKGRNTVRHLVIPTNPQTTGQQNARAGIGSAGKVNHYVEKGSGAQIALTDAAPSGQSGASYYAGLQAKAFATSKTDYANATYSTIKGYFDSAAATLGLSTLTIPGVTPVTVSGGLQLWNAYDVMHSIDSTLAPTTAKTATAANITTFVDSLSV